MRNSRIGNEPADLAEGDTWVRHSYSTNPVPAQDGYKFRKLMDGDMQLRTKTFEKIEHSLGFYDTFKTVQRYGGAKDC